MQIVFIREWSGHKLGEKLDVDQLDAARLIKHGYAEKYTAEHALAELQEAGHTAAQAFAEHAEATSLDLGPAQPTDSPATGDNDKE